MSLLNESLLVVLLIGLLAGWIAGNIAQGSGLGLAGDLTLGMVGAFVGHWLLPRMHIHLGHGLVSLVLDAAIGAILLLLIVRLIAFGRRWGESEDRVSRGFESRWRAPS